MGCLSKSVPEVDGDPIPPAPNSAEDIKTLAGIDSDNDGVRDDIEILINTKYHQPNHRNGLKQFVRYRQRAMLLANDREKSKAETIKALESLSCLIELGHVTAFDDAAEIQAEFYNTNIRMDAYRKTQQNLHGVKLDVKQPGYYLNKCEFKIEQ